MTILSIPDMTCGHCKAAVEAALTPIAAPVTVNLAARTVEVAGVASTDSLLAALDRIGFPAEVIVV